jgi:hypothetical protein
VVAYLTAKADGWKRRAAKVERAAKRLAQPVVQNG